MKQVPEQIDAAPISPSGTGSAYGTSSDDWFDLRGSTSNTFYAYNASQSPVDSGNDTYIFGAGGGQDNIQEYSTTSNLDTIKVVGLSTSQVSLVREVDTQGNTYNLLLKRNGSTDQVRVYNEFNGVDAAPVTPTAAGAANGTAGADWFDLRGSTNNTFYGNTSGALDSGNDTYLFGIGSGQDTVQDYGSATGNTDVLKISAGAAADQIWLRQAGNNLEVSIIGLADKVTIQNWYTNSAYHVEQLVLADGKTLLDSNVQNLVNAMASFSPPSPGQTTLPQNYADALSPTIAANWQQSGG